MVSQWCWANVILIRGRRPDQRFLRSSRPWFAFLWTQRFLNSREPPFTFFAGGDLSKEILVQYNYACCESCSGIPAVCPILIDLNDWMKISSTLALRFSIRKYFVISCSTTYSHGCEVHNVSARMVALRDIHGCAYFVISCSTIYSHRCEVHNVNARMVVLEGFTWLCIFCDFL